MPQRRVEGSNVSNHKTASDEKESEDVPTKEEYSVQSRVYNGGGCLGGSGGVDVVRG